MDVLRRCGISALVGGLVWASLYPVVELVLDTVCVGNGMELCLAVSPFASKAWLVVWPVLTMVLLHVLRCRPAWLVGLAGSLLAAALWILLLVARVPLIFSVEFMMGLPGAIGYGLAAALTARYGERRDREDASISG